MGRHLLFVVLSLIALGCSRGDGDTPNDEVDVATPEQDAGVSVSENQLIYQLADYPLEPFAEVQPCVTWRLENEKPLYVNTVTLANAGAFHHSNWFVVPEEMYVGEDGYFDCSSRGFDELSSAVSGTVLFAQSTQSLAESQALPDGVVVKIPPRHRIVAGLHFLNLSARSMTTRAKLSFKLTHPADVQVVVAPFRLGYGDLHIPPERSSHHTGECPMDETYAESAGRPLDMKIYYVLPHYHAYGDYFRLEIMGGPNDGQVIHEMSDFDGEANGKSFDPPIDLTGAIGLRLTCGFTNPTDEEIGWGIGDQEMCEFLGLADTGTMIDGWVRDHNYDGVDDGQVISYVSPCTTQGVPKNEAQTMPSQDEVEAPLYRPSNGVTDADVTPIDRCVDTPNEATGDSPATLSSIRETIFKASCSYSACHGNGGQAGGLSLEADDLWGRLVNQPSFGQSDRMLIKPGSPEESELYRLISRCEPNSGAGRHMPLNSPVLLEPALVAKVRDWIQAGAPE